MLELRAKCQVQSVIRQADFVLKESAEVIKRELIWL